MPFEASICITTDSMTEKQYFMQLGKNVAENNMLIDYTKEFHPEYIWLHLNDFTSGHVIIHCTKNELTKDIINHAGQFCFSHTKHAHFIKKRTKKLKVIWTEVKNLKKTKIKGEVEFYDPNFTTICSIAV